MSSPRCHSSIMVPVHVLSTSSASRFSIFTFPSAAAFSFFARASASSLSACVAAFFVAAVFLLIFVDDPLVFFFRSQASQLQCFFCLLSPFMLYFSCFPFRFL